MIHTPTADDVGGDLSQITTRIPPDTQNQVDYADVLGKEPIVLLFATPQFCQSRVCGPVVDVAEQVKQLYGDKAAFIHMEICNDNDPGKGTRPQVKDFNLPTEPWLFVIDREGTITDVIEGAFGVEELTRGGRRGGRAMSPEKKPSADKKPAAEPDPELLESFADRGAAPLRRDRGRPGDRDDRLRDDARRGPRPEGHRRRRRPAPPGRARGADGIRPRRSEEDRRDPRRPQPPDRRRRQGARRGRLGGGRRARRSRPTSAAPSPSSSAPEHA